MCYTAQDSLNAYIINSISSILLYNVSKDAQYKVISLFLLFVGQMQIFDYTFWKNQSCTVTNKVATKLAIAFNHLQPVVLYLLQTLYGFKQSLVSSLVFGLYLVFGIFYNVDAFSSIDCTIPLKGVMNWKWNKLQGSELYYFFFIAYLVVASFNFHTDSLKFLFAFLTLFTIVVANKTPILNLSVGRIWCYYAALVPLFLLGVSILF